MIGSPFSGGARFTDVNLRSDSTFDLTSRCNVNLFHYDVAPQWYDSCYPDVGSLTDRGRHGMDFSMRVIQKIETSLDSFGEWINGVSVRIVK